jgi:lipopolysaccharide transport system ATP-binding protein
MSSDLTLSAQNLSKAYHIWKTPQDRLKQILMPWKKYYSEYWALRDLSIEIARGEAVGIIGRNGAGKSTFLQLACGTLEPTSGSVSLTGRVAALLELGAGFNPEFTGRENVMLSASILGLSQQEIKDRFESIADFAAIGDFIDLPVKLYSSGMYARLAFAVAAHVDADVLVIDEILSVGDVAFGQKCTTFIKKFRERGSLLFVSHNPESVLTLCDRAIWLDGGETREIGPAKDVCRAYLRSLESEKDDSARFQTGGKRWVENKSHSVHDHRAEKLIAEGIKNKISVFAFNPEGEWFGRRGGSILNTRILDVAGEPISFPVGGQEVVLRIECEAHQPIVRPIVGFYVKNRLGLALFGDNTYYSLKDEAISVEANQKFAAEFRFRLPYLPAGDYVINTALAEGTQDDHVQHHWIEEAVILTASGGHVQHGLMGIPMLDISLDRQEPGDNERPETLTAR